MNIALIGCGNIGTALAMFLDKQSGVKISSLCDSDLVAAFSLKEKLNANEPEIVSMKEAVEKSDLIIETASPDAVKEILKHISLHQKKKKFLVISTGGLISKNIFQNEFAEIYFPSGAIAGLDAIRAVEGKIKSLQLITTKPAAGLQQSPFVQKQKIKLSSLKKQKIIFEGGVREAVKNFPQNINVAASLFLTSGFEKIKVQIVADPNATLNKHEIICKGKFGTIHTITENVPSKNPKTSELALLSAEKTLKEILLSNRKEK